MKVRAYTALGGLYVRSLGNGADVRVRRSTAAERSGSNSGYGGGGWFIANVSPRTLVRADTADLRGETIRQARYEAALAGDSAMVRTLDRASAGSRRAISTAVRILREAAERGGE